MSGRPDPAGRARRLAARAAAAAHFRLTPRATPTDTAEYAAVLDLAREGPAPLRARKPAPGAPLHVGVVVPPFRRGSGGHQTIANVVRGLEARGHRCDVWVEDPAGLLKDEDVDALWDEFFGSHQGAVRAAPGPGWGPPDVALATGWQTVHRVMRLPGVAARAYLVQDHEPEFHPASAQRRWAEDTYRLGLHCITAEPWLAAVVQERYGASASPFPLGVDDRYRAEGARGEGSRDPATVVFYARALTDRRAVPLGLLALQELQRRRFDAHVVLFGDPAPPAAPFRFEHRGVLEHRDLAELYRSATVGVVLSMTNVSLLPFEMLSCGLPVVELDGPSVRAALGDDPPVELAAFDPVALADGIERLLDDPALRAERGERGRALVVGRTWERAAEWVEAGLREAVARSAA